MSYPSFSFLEVGLYDFIGLRYQLSNYYGFIKLSLLLAICLIGFLPLTAYAFDEIEAKKGCDKWVEEGGSYLMWAKEWKQVEGGLQRKWKIKRVSKRVCKTDLLSNHFIGLEYQIRDGKVLAKNEIVGKKHQLITKRIFLFKP